MELPLRIVVSFIVVMIVGISIITISQDLLSNSSKNVEQIGKIANEEKMIEKSSFNNDEIDYLKQNCIEQYQFTTKEKELCYILKSDNPITYSGISGKTLYIYFEKTTQSAIISD